MESSNHKSPVRTLLESVMTIVMVLTFFLLTVVVIMLVTGTMHVLNRNYFQLPFINALSAIAAVVILILSVSFFIRAFKSMRSTMIKVLFHDHAEY